MTSRIFLLFHLSKVQIFSLLHFNFDKQSHQETEKYFYVYFVTVINLEWDSFFSFVFFKAESFKFFTFLLSYLKIMSTLSYQNTFQKLFPETILRRIMCRNCHFFQMYVKAKLYSCFVLNSNINDITFRTCYMRSSDLQFYVCVIENRPF
jgi:hypothetical protein